MYVAAFVLGLLIDRWAPGPAQFVLGEGRASAPPLRIAAVVLITLGVVLGPLNALRFLLRRTTLNPNKRASVFLTQGIYAVSRNPMYLGLFLIYCGVAVLQRAVWPFVTIGIPFLVVDRVIIPFEERQMAERYGAAYRDYCAKVGRWITLRAPKRSTDDHRPPEASP
jgi:protein-S-isoprenylcysteine O-methyltransferase Ste14